MVAGLARKSWKAGTPWRVPNKICFDPPRETRKSSRDAKESPEIGNFYHLNVNNLFWGPIPSITKCVSFCTSSDNRKPSRFAPGAVHHTLTYTPIESWTQWACECFCWADQVAVQRMLLDSYTHAKVLPNTAIQTYTTHGLLHWCHQWSKYKASGSFPYIVFVLSSTPFANHCHASTPSLTQANHARTYALDQWTCSPKHMASWWLMLTLSTA